MKILIISLMFILLATFSYAKDVVIISNFSMKDSLFLGLIQEIKEHVPKETQNFLFFQSNCENELQLSQCVLEWINIEKQILLVKPTHILLLSPQTTFFIEKLSEYLIHSDVRIGAFNIFHDKSNIYPNYCLESNNEIFFMTYDLPDIEIILTYITRNAAIIDNFYILYENTIEKIAMVNYLRRELKKTNAFLNIKLIEVNTTQNLKNMLIQLQKEQRGFIIPLFTNLYDIEKKRKSSINDIIEIITRFNKVHLELSVLFNAKDKLSFSLFSNHDGVNYTNVFELFFKYDAKCIHFNNDSTLLFISTKRLNQLIRGRELLRNLNHERVILD